MVPATKKKVLFMIGNLESGGVSKSMVNLLQAFDRECYDVSLWIGSPGGLYQDLVPDNVRIIRDPLASYALQGIRGVMPLFLRGHWMTLLLSVTRLLLSRVDKAAAGWLLSRMFVPLKDEYDAIIDYNGQHQLYFMVDKLKACKKITFFHSDYSQWNFYQRIDKKYFPKVDAICSISPHCVQVLKETFPDCASKMSLVENITSPRLINKLAEEEAEGMADVPQRHQLVTIGHVCPEKGTDLAIQAAAILKNGGLPFKWHFIGCIHDKAKYASLLRQYHVEDCVEFMGMKQNPYPYIKKASIIVHPSRFEGKSIALDEAKLLCKPIVVTRFSTVNDQFADGYNASICDMTAESLAASIMELSADADKREQYISHLHQDMTDNSNEVEKLYHLIGK